MSYLHIENLYNNQDILFFREAFALEKIDGTSSHLSFKDNDLTFFAGGAKHENFISLFDKEKLLNIFKEMQLEHGTPDITVYGEAYGGCFCYNTPILLSDGSKKQIGGIVNKKLPLEVMCYNFKEQRIENKRITNWFKYPARDDEWITVYFEKRLRGGKTTKVITTKNHLFYVKEGLFIKEKTANEMKNNDIVFLPSPKLSYIQEQVVRGSLLGDGSIKTNKNFFSCGHSKKQIEYFNLKRKILNSVSCGTTEYKSGFGSQCINLRTKSMPEFINLKNSYFKNQKKVLSVDALKRLHPIAFAFWYMDDGTLRKNNYDNKFHSDVCRLCTDGFSEREVESAIDYLNSIGFFCYKIKEKKYFRISFTPEGTLAFHSVISPYIIKEMKYKIIDKFKNIPCFWDDFVDFDHDKSNLIETKVNKIVKGSKYKNGVYVNTKYDLEIEGNHNYFANNILVHNSMQGMSATYGKELKFIVFEVKIGEHCWLDVPKSEKIAERLGLEFVPYEKVSTDIESLNAVRDKDSEIAVRRGIGTGKKREGVVLRPLIEVRRNNGERIIAKHKRDDFRETKTPREVNPEKLKVLGEAGAIANEWVTVERMKHVLDGFMVDGELPGIDRMGEVLKAMVEDVMREGNKEIIDSKDARKAISARTATLFKNMLKEKIK